MVEKILTIHPEGKKGVNIELRKYNNIKDAILKILGIHKEITLKRLLEEVQNEFINLFEGSITWYVLTVKLDLEARNIIKRISNKSPQKLSLVK
ncbi:MAG: DUF6958 family protein [Candidatus Hodarchaeales archaeon]|jgi:hypothetical protein